MWRVAARAVLPYVLVAFVAGTATAQPERLSAFGAEQLRKTLVGSDAYEAGRYADAARIFQENYETTRQYRILLFRYARSLALTGRDEAAQREFSLVLSDDPPSLYSRTRWNTGFTNRSETLGAVHFELGRIHARRLAWAEALEEYTLASNLGLARGALFAGNVQLDQRKDFVSAIAAYERALLLAGADATLQQSARTNLGIAHRGRARELLAAGKRDEAIQSLRAALSFQPGWKEAQDELRLLAPGDPALASANAPGAAGAVTPAAPAATALKPSLVAEWFTVVSGTDTVRAGKLRKGEPALLAVLDSAGLTALHRARSVPMVEHLVNAGAPVSAAARDGRTPLHLAAARGDLAVAQALLTRGADADKWVQGFGTPLHAALGAGAGARALVALLAPRASPGSINSPSDPGAQWPLMLVAAAGDQEMADLLIANGADVVVRDANGKTMGDLAAERAHAALAAHLRALATFGQRPSDRVIEASEAKQTAVVKQLLALAPALANARHSRGTYPAPLLIASYRGADDIVILLLSAGARLDVRDDQGNSPLLLAVSSSGREALVGRLLTAGADVSARNKSGQTVLHRALGAFPAGPAVVRSLLLAKAPLDLRDNQGATPIWLAVDACHAGELEVLVQSGYHGQPPKGLLGSAAGNMKTDRCAFRLLELGADANDRESAASMTPLMIAASWQRAALVAQLLARGADPRLADGQGRTALHWADSSVAVALLEKGADPNALARDLGTPLHAAAKRLDAPAITLLLARGAKVNQVDGAGKTPLDLVAELAASNRTKAITELLVARGARTGKDAG